MSTERTEFEAWATEECYQLARYEDDHDGEGDYMVSTTRDAWRGWQAGRKVALEEAAKLVDHILKEGGGTYGDAIKELLK